MHPYSTAWRLEPPTANPLDTKISALILAIRSAPSIPIAGALLRQLVSLQRQRLLGKEGSR